MIRFQNCNAGGRLQITCAVWFCIAQVIGSVWLLVLCSGLAVAQQHKNVNEYERKAAFLYNFARFVDWHNAKTDSDMLFCIASDQAVSTQIETAISGKKLGTRKIQVQQLLHGADVTQCSLIFVAESSPREFQSVCSQVADMEILTVTETREFPRGGSILNFNGEHEHVRFEIAIRAADRAGIKLSSKLMSLGRIIRGKTSGEQ